MDKENRIETENVKAVGATAVIGLVVTSLPIIIPLLKDLKGPKKPNARCLVSVNNETDFGLEHVDYIHPHGELVDLPELPAVAPALRGGLHHDPYIFQQSFCLASYEGGYIVNRSPPPAAVMQYRILLDRPVYLFFAVDTHWRSGSNNYGYFNLYEKAQDLQKFWHDRKEGKNWFSPGELSKGCDINKETGPKFGFYLHGELSPENPATFEIFLSHA